MSNVFLEPDYANISFSLHRFDHLNTIYSFSLFPSQNATGNWVKISQRFPVVIELEHDEQNKTDYPLRLGASATVTVNTLAPMQGQQ